MAEPENIRGKTIAGLFWTFAERIGAQLVSFVVSIVLARLLMPEEYGIIAIVWVFINICNVFVNSGFGRSLIQKKNADDLDFSSVFWFSMGMSLLLYAGLFLAAPWIARWYDMELLCPVLRVMGLRLIVAAFNTVQKAKVSKEMQFKKFFFSTIGGTLFSAVVGIAMAYMGYGVWALVAQELTNVCIDTTILFITISWRPRLQFSLERMKGLFRYGWKVLVSSLIDTLYEDFRSLYVGKLYTAEDLAYYTRGKQFPHLLVDNVNSSIASVLFPAISAAQGDPDAVKAMARRAMKTSSFVLTPMLVGLAAVAEPMITLLLTEKWLPCVPFLQIICISCALLPLQTANVQAINAVGRSDITLKLSVIKKSFGLVMIIAFTRISVEAMAWAGVATGVFSLLVNAFPNRKLIDYGLKEQLRDIVPNWLLSAAMLVLVRLVHLAGLSLIPELIVMVLVGVVSYVAMSVIFRVESFTYIWKMLKPVLGSFLKK